MSLSGALPFEDSKDVWEDVYAEQDFAFEWPPATANEDGTTTTEDGANDTPDPQDIVVVNVEAVSYPEVVFDREGVRGAYKWCALFKPDVRFAHHERYPNAIYGYLYYYAPDPEQFKLVPYTVTYLSGAVRVWIIRVWQDYNIGGDWIVQRIAAEEARDAMAETALENSTHVLADSMRDDNPCPQ